MLLFWPCDSLSSHIMGLTAGCLANICYTFIDSNFKILQADTNFSGNVASRGLTVYGIVNKLLANCTETTQRLITQGI